MPLRQQSLDGFVGFVRGRALHVMRFLENPIRTFFGFDHRVGHFRPPGMVDVILKPQIL